MNKIYYLTTAQDSKSFTTFLSKCKVAPNLSNQNFHNKLIKAISLQNNVEVISCRPITKNYDEKLLNKSSVEDKNILWKYPKVSSSICYKQFALKKAITDEMKEINKGDIILVDALNKRLLDVALKFAKTNKVIGICTDNPYNISFASNCYKQSIIKKGRKLNGYICLTDGLNKLFNTKNKPALIISGIADEIEFGQKEIDDDYIYFGGSLLPQYGVINLIEAFKQLKTSNLKLVIAGHHENKEFLDSINDSNIIYLKAVDYERNMNLAHFSKCCINPRPANAEIDKYSYPSKVIEYLSSGSITISTRNKQIENDFNNCLIWAEGSNPQSLALAIKKALDLESNEIVAFIKVAETSIKNSVSLNAISNKITNYLFK